MCRGSAKPSLTHAMHRLTHAMHLLKLVQLMSDWKVPTQGNYYRYTDTRLALYNIAVLGFFLNVSISGQQSPIKPSIVSIKGPE